MPRSISSSLRGALLAVALFAALVPPAWAVTVQLRVEGKSSTIFEGQVNTTAHLIGGHKCDGTNGGASTTPGPTITSALDDGASVGNYSWDYTYNAQFDDLFINRIGPDSNDPNAGQFGEFWGYSRNYQAATAGGCQIKVSPGDEILFGYDFFSKAHLLKLYAPDTVGAGQNFQVKVEDGQNRDAIEGASVGGKLTGADGTAILNFSSAGNYPLKAERSDSLRSNLVVVQVQGTSSSQPTSPGTSGTSGTGSGSCPAGQTSVTTTTGTYCTTSGQGTTPSTTTPSTTTPTTSSGGGSGGGSTNPTNSPRNAQTIDYDPPTVRIVGLKDRGEYEVGPRRIQGLARDESGLDQVFVRLIRKHDGECSWFSVARRRFNQTCARPRFVPVGDRTLWQLVFRGRLGAGKYVLQVRARDKAGNAYPSTDDGRSRIHFKVMG